MARHRRREAARIEPPPWYRVFDPAGWQEPDAHERSMIDGCAGFGRPWPDSPDSAWAPGWPEFLHQEHARRRWQEARYSYRRQHQDLAGQEFAGIRARRETRREDVGHG